MRHVPRAVPAAAGFDSGNVATCGVQFSGWTDGGGNILGSWTSFPGNGEGYWTANVNYSGKAGFGNTATLLGGSWELIFRNGTVFKGTVSAGAVIWPAQSGRFDNYA